jgi:hypothetical protein
MVLPSPSHPLTRAFLVTVAWLVAVAGAVGLVVAASAGTALAGGSSGFSFIFGGLALAVATEASVGAVLMLRRPGNVVGLVLMVAAIFLAVTILGFVAGAVLTEERGRHDLLAGLASLFGGLSVYPALIVAGPLMALVFPDGRLPGSRWRWPVGAIVATIALGSAIMIARPGAIGDGLADNPLGLGGFTGSEAVWPMGESLAAVALLLALLLAIAAVIVRFRRSRGVERAQLKWFVAATVATGTFLLLSDADGSTQTIFDLIAPWSLSLPPIAVGIAILRYRLYGIDRLISRTVSWAIVTAVLVSTFAAVVVALQAILARFTEGETLAVAGSTLVAFALFQPLRRRVQAVVDRRFDRASYDAQRTVEGFAAGLRDEFDLERLGGELGAVVGQALAPTSVGVWLRPSLRIPGR